MHCPTCGAALSGYRGGTCPWCGAVVPGSQPNAEESPPRWQPASHQNPLSWSQPGIPPEAHTPDPALPYPPGSSETITLPPPLPRELFPDPAPVPSDGWISDPQRTRAAGGTPGLPPQVPHPPMWPSSPRTEQTRRNRWPGIVIVVLVAIIVGLLLKMAVGGETTGVSTGSIGQRMVFSDSLRSNSGGWVDKAGECFFKRDGYHIANGHVCFAPVLDIGDGDYAVYAKQISGDTAPFYGIAFRRAKPGDFYEFAVDGQGQWIFARVVDAVPTAIRPAEPSSLIATGLNAANHLEVKAQGSHFDLFINGHQVGSVTDSTYRTGQCGLLASPSVEAVFTNLSVKK